MVLVESKRGGGFHNHEAFDALNLNLVSINPKRVLNQVKFAAVDPAFHCVGAAGDDQASFRPLLTPFIDGPFGHGINNPHASDGGEVPGRILEGELHCVVIQGNHTKIIQCQLFIAAIDGLGILDDVGYVSIVRASFRIDGSLGAINYVIGVYKTGVSISIHFLDGLTGDRIVLNPDDIIAEVEGPGLVAIGILASFPFSRQVRGYFTTDRVEFGQTHKQVSCHIH